MFIIANYRVSDFGAEDLFWLERFSGRATYHSFDPAGVVTYLPSVTEQLAECLKDREATAKAKAMQSLLLVLQRFIKTL
jgi:hypothetical protein